VSEHAREIIDEMAAERTIEKAVDEAWAHALRIIDSKIMSFRAITHIQDPTIAHTIRVLELLRYDVSIRSNLM
jgi:hypothetical protein